MVANHMVCTHGEHMVCTHGEHMVCTHGEHTYPVVSTCSTPMVSTWWAHGVHPWWAHGVHPWWAHTPMVSTWCTPMGSTWCAPMVSTHTCGGHPWWAHTPVVVTMVNTHTKVSVSYAFSFCCEWDGEEDKGNIFNKSLNWLCLLHVNPTTYRVYSDQGSVGLEIDSSSISSSPNPSYVTNTSSELYIAADTYAAVRTFPNAAWANFWAVMHLIVPLYEKCILWFVLIEIMCFVLVFY